MIAKITFEDKSDYIVIGIENAMADNPTLAQQAVITLFAKIKDEARDDIEVLGQSKIILRRINETQRAHTSPRTAQIQ